MDGATLDDDVDAVDVDAVVVDAADAAAGMAANPTSATTTDSSRIHGECSTESALMASSEPCSAKRVKGLNRFRNRLRSSPECDGAKERLHSPI